MTIDLNLVPVFLAVAEEGNFRAAADRLGVTRSAVSQGIRRLEDICGIALVSRTTRSVRLTEAGNRLHETLSQPMAEVRSAFENVAGDARPSGLLRIAVTSIAEQFLSGPLIASFAETHPGITIDVTVTDDVFDIVAAGFDAGVRLGEVIEQDMVAVPLTKEEREVVVATPRYFELHGTPAILGSLCVIAVLVGVRLQVLRRIDGSSRRMAYLSTSPSSRKSPQTICT